MSAAELKKLKASGGLWCFVDGARVRRKDRIKALEALAASKKKGRTKKNEDTQDTETAPDEA